MSLLRIVSGRLSVRASTVIIVINKGLDTDGGALAVVSDLLMRDLDVVEVFQGLGSLTQRKGKVYMKGEAQGHDMGIELIEFEGGGILWQGV